MKGGCATRLTSKDLEYQMIVVEDTLKVNKENPTNIFKVLRRGSVIEITLKPTVYE